MTIDAAIISLDHPDAVTYRRAAEYYYSLRHGATTAARSRRCDALESTLASGAIRAQQEPLVRIAARYGGGDVNA